MRRTARGGLAKAIRDALDDEALAKPAAVLALVYARRIDEANHVRATLDKALRILRQAAEAYDVEGVQPSAVDAFAKVSALLSAVTVAADLGPKLLAALDALLLTPKAQGAVGPGEGAPAGPPANPLQQLRAEQDELAARRDSRAAR